MKMRHRGNDDSADEHIISLYEEKTGDLIERDIWRLSRAIITMKRNEDEEELCREMKMKWNEEEEIIHGMGE